jgi:acetylserotonin O-methyltransferase
MSPFSLPDAKPVLDLIEAFRGSKAMFSAVSLGIFDYLERSAASLEDLALELQCQVDPLERLLNACVGLKLLRKDGNTYSNQEVATTYLCRTSPNTLVGYILYSDQVLFRLWAHLEDAIRRGGPQWERVFGENGGIFDQFFRTDEAMTTFLKGMHALGVLSSPLVVAAFDLSRFRRFVDLGGATGHLAIAACERYPDLRATVFDLPRVIDAVHDNLSQVTTASRIELRKGDFFNPEEIPTGDLFGLSRILHDWPDDKVVPLLESIHGHLEVGGGILISEKLLYEDKGGPTSALMQSLNMLVCTEGKERTLSEYRRLLEDAGFEAVRGHVTGAPLDAVFAVKG